MLALFVLLVFRYRSESNNWISRRKKTFCELILSLPFSFLDFSFDVVVDDRNIQCVAVLSVAGLRAICGVHHVRQVLHDVAIDFVYSNPSMNELSLQNELSREDSRVFLYFRIFPRISIVPHGSASLSFLVMFVYYYY